MKKSNQSILDEVKKTKRSSKIYWSIGIILFFIALFFVGKWYQSQNPDLPEIQYTKTLQKNIKLSVEEDGEIKNPQDFNLAFLTGGKVEQILVEEGEKVEAGQKLAILDRKSLNLRVRSARADIQSVYAQIKQRKAENTNLEFLQSQSVLTTKESDILTTQKLTTQKVKESFDLGRVQIETSLYRLQNILDSVDSVFSFKNNLNPKIQRIFNDTIRYNQVKNDFETLSQKLETEKNIWNSKKSNAEYADISRRLWKIKLFADEIAKYLDQTIYLFSNGKTSQNISLQDIQGYQSRLSAEKDKLRLEIQTLVTVKKSTENSLINQQTEIKSAHNRLEQAVVETENAEKMVVQKEVFKKANLSSSYAQLAQAQANLEMALYNLSLATLSSPTTGEVLKIEKEVGEITNMSEPFIKILSDENFIVEVYIEELDIAKIEVGQKANIRIAALEDKVLEGITTYISSNATEDNNGVITYLVRIELENGREFPIKEKMTASVEFILDEVKEVIALPIETIFQNKDGKSAVLMEDLTEKVIETGLSDNTFVEIKSGLEKENIKIIKNPQDFVNLKTEEKEIIRKELIPEIKKELEDLGFDEKEIQRIEVGELEDELTDRLREAQKAENGGISKMMKN